MDGKTGSGRDRQGAKNRQVRLAAQLRSNLTKRKSQSRTRQESANPDGQDRVAPLNASDLPSKG